MNSSVIIPTANSLSQMEPTLVSLAAMSTRPDEVIVVQNGLSEIDRVRDLASYPAITKKYSELNLMLFYDDVPGLLSGRHRGYQESSGSLLIFVDDDVTFDRDWLAALEATFHDPEIVLAGGPSLPVFAAEPPAWMQSFWCDTAYGGRQMAQLSLQELAVNEIVVIDPDLVWGLNYAIRRETLRQRGGFHPDCVPAQWQHFQGDGETGLSRKIVQAGEKAVYNPAAIVHHHIGTQRMTVAYFERRSFYQGVCDSYTQIRSGNDPSELLASFDTESKFWPLKIARRLKRMVVASRQSDSLENLFAKAYRRGFEFHCGSVISSPRLLQWVRRENYFDYHYPDLEPDFSPALRSERHSLSPSMTFSSSRPQ